MIGTLAAVVTVLLLAAFIVAPSSYVVQGPGPTENVLGEVSVPDSETAQGSAHRSGAATTSTPSGDAAGDHASSTTDTEPLITVTGADVHPTSGKLLMTTVSGWGMPSHPLSALNVLRSWFSKKTSVVPMEVLYPPRLSEEQTNERNTAEMKASQQAAVVAALTELDYDVPATLTITQGVTHGDVSHDSAVGADDVLAGDVVKPGDVIKKLDGTAPTSYQDLLDQVATLRPGEEVTLTVARDGKDVQLHFHTVTALDNATTGSATDDSDAPSAMLGVGLDPKYHPPIDVDIALGQKIGGPSAGSTFALGIVDKLSGDDLTHGDTVAGTGTIDADGTIGPIGGIRQKMWGARQDGATVFLAPASNCDEVVGHIPPGLAVYAVSTLHEDRETLAAVGEGHTDGLPTCGAAGDVAR